MLKYNEVLKLAKDKINEVMAPLRAKEMKKKAELKIAELESKLAEEDQKVQEIASQYPIDFDKLLKALDERDWVQRRTEQLLEIIEKLFADEEKKEEKK